MEDDIADLQVHAVDERELRESLLSQVDTAPGSAPAIPPDDVPALQRQLRSLRTELAAVEDSLAAAKRAADGAESSGAEALPLGETPGAHAAAALQVATIHRRRADLEARVSDAAARLHAALGGGARAPSSATAAPQPLPRQPKKARLTKLEADDVFGRHEASLTETERDRLIRQGLLTPFDSLEGFERRLTEARLAEDVLDRTARALRDAKASRPTTRLVARSDLPASERLPRRMAEGFWRVGAAASIRPASSGARKRREAGTGQTARAGGALLSAHPTRQEIAALVRSGRGGAGAERAHTLVAGPGALPCDSDVMEDDVEGVEPERALAVPAQVKVEEGEDGKEELLAGEAAVEEDGKEESLAGEAPAEEDGKEELLAGVDARPASLSRRPTCPQPRSSASASPEVTSSNEEEELPDMAFEGGLNVPGSLYARLFPHQRTCLKWLWELHCQRVGGIVADDMGLGKTVQIASFLAAMRGSSLLERSSLIVCPATLRRQWQRELRRWAPRVRVRMLHDSASRRDRGEDEGGNFEEEEWGQDGGSQPLAASPSSVAPPSR